MTSVQFSTIHLASDHAGWTHKEAVKTWLTSLAVTVVDHGAYTLVAEDDFNEFINEAVVAMQTGGVDHGAIVFGGSGQGEAMMANRQPGVRAGVYYGGNIAIVTLSRQHNNANVLSLGVRFLTLAETKIAIEKWLGTAFLSTPKYQRRNDKLDYKR